MPEDLPELEGNLATFHLEGEVCRFVLRVADGWIY